MASNHSHRKLQCLIGLILVAGIFLVYWPVTNHDFINYDDDLYIYNNPHIRDGLTWQGIKWTLSANFFSDSPNADFWIPVTYLSHLLSVELFGLNPSGHHLLNLALHMMNTLLLFLIFDRLTGALWSSAFIAALFAIHPLNVESVAWVTERKDVLSTFFWMLTLWAYARYSDQPNLKRYLFVALALALGLMSKPMLVSLPFVLLLMDFWPLKRFTLAVIAGPNGIKRIGKLFLEKVPLLALCIGSAAITYSVVQKAGAIISVGSLPLVVRAENALVSYGGYIGKMVWPRGLAVFYPHPENTLSLWQMTVAGLLLILTSILATGSIRTRPYLIVGWLWYMGTLVPVIGLFQAGEQAVADRYTYVPLIGLFIMIAWGVPDLLSKWKHRKAFLQGISGGIILSLMIITFLQVRYWHNSITLFEHALDVTTKNYIAHYNLGVAYQDRGDHDKALLEYQQAVQIRPGFAEAREGLGYAYQRIGRLEEASRELQIALRLRPNSAATHYNLAKTYSQQGRTTDAIREYHEAIRRQHDFPEAHHNLGIIYENAGKWDQAIKSYEMALRSRPGYVKAHNNLGNVYQKMDELDKAVKEYQAALKLRPDFFEARNNLGNTYQKMERFEEAIREYQIAIGLQSDIEQIHYNMGIAYQINGQVREAKYAFEQALVINPNYRAAQEALISLSQ